VLLDAGISAGDVEVGVCERQGSADGRHARREARAVGGLEDREEILADRGNPGERGFGVAEHETDADATGRPVHHDERLGEIGVQFEQAMHLVGEILADAQLVTRAEQRSQVETHGFESAAEIVG